MTGRRRRGGGSHGSSGSRTTRRDGGSDTTRRDGAPGDGPGGHGVGANVDAIDTMAGRLDATRTRIDGVGTTVRGVNVGPQSMGVLGSGFTGAAQSHLRTTEQHVTRTTEAVERAQRGTRGTAQGYRDTDTTNAANLAKPDNSTTPPTTRADTTRRVPGDAVTIPDATRRDSAGTTAPASTATTHAPPTSIGDRLNQPADTSTPAVSTGRYQPSARELELRNRQVTDVAPLKPGAHVNDAFTQTFDDGSSGVYKPIDGEDASLRESIPGGLANREVAAYRIDEALGLDLVPTTTMSDGHRGPGSLQEFVGNTSDGLDARDYPKVQQEQMAVLDYVTGNTDRHGGNYLTGEDGRLVAIDHGYSFPEGKDAFGIRSDFVADHLNQPLSDDVMAKLRAADPAAVRGMLHDTGLSAAAIDGAMARFMEIREHGMITGEAWPGRIHTGGMGRVRGSIA